MAYWKGTASEKNINTNWTTWELEGIPENCCLSELVVLLTNISATASRLTVFVSHDDAGIIGVVPFVTSGATQTINVRDEPEGEDLPAGFVAFNLGSAWFSDQGENPRVHCRLDSGTASATPRLYAHRGGQP